jgi:hypothetical protein
MRIVLATMTTNAADAADTAVSPVHGIEMCFCDFTLVFECESGTSKDEKRELRKENS